MESYLIISSGNPQVFTSLMGLTLEQFAAERGVVDPSLYASFIYGSFEPACYSFPGGFEINLGVVNYDLPGAKTQASGIVNAQSNEAAKATLANLSYDVYIAQASLPAEQRIAKYQAAIDANNANALETEQREQAIYAATTIDEVYAVVYPAQA